MAVARCWSQFAPFRQLAFTFGLITLGTVGVDTFESTSGIEARFAAAATGRKVCLAFVDIFTTPLIFRQHLKIRLHFLNDALWAELVKNSPIFSNFIFWLEMSFLTN